MGLKKEGTGKGREEDKATRGAGQEWREGAALGSAVLTLGSFLPNLSPAKAGEAL